MIINIKNNLVFYEISSGAPAIDWTGKAEHIIDERDPSNAVLISKIKRFAPRCEPVIDGTGKLVDVTPKEAPEPTPDDDAITAEEALAILLGGDSE